MDVHDKKTRSLNMSRIKGKDTKPEILVRRACHYLGLRFRLHRKDMPGKPDLVFPRHETVIFVNGCFWHSHDCKYGAVTPKTRAAFWKEKRDNTILRDKRNTLELIRLGWRVLTYWECGTKEFDQLASNIRRDFELVEKGVDLTLHV